MLYCYVLVVDVVVPKLIPACQAILENSMASGRWAAGVMQPHADEKVGRFRCALEFSPYTMEVRVLSKSLLGSIGRLSVYICFCLFVARLTSRNIPAREGCEVPNANHPYFRLYQSPISCQLLGFHPASPRLASPNQPGCASIPINSITPRQHTAGTTSRQQE